MPRFWLAIILLVTLVVPLTNSYAQGGDEPVAPPSDTELPLGNLVYTADFSDETIWAEYNDNNLVLNPADGGYEISNTNPEDGLGLFAPTRIDYADVYTEISFNITGCNDDISALLFAVRDVNFADNYVFVLQCNGSFRSRPIISGNVGNIDQRGLADGVAIETTHDMGILIVGNAVTWYLDGIELASYTARGTVDEGAMTFGAQSGIEFTLTSWRVWEVEDSAPPTVENNGDDPLRNEEFSHIIYHPEFQPPSTIIYGLHYPIARYYNPNGVGMYNNDETAIMALPEVNEEDYYFEINYFVRSCRDDGVVSIIWRASADLSDFYVLAVECDGGYRSRVVLDGEAGDILASGDTSPMMPDTLLSISVYVRGDTAYLYYNQNLLTTIDTSALDAGTPGILLQSSSEGATVDILVSDLIVVGVSD